MIKKSVRLLPVLGLLMIGAMMPSCEKSDFSISDTSLEELDVTLRSNTDGVYSEGISTDGKGRDICFRPIFPVTLVFADSTSLEVGDLEELKSAIMEWKSNHPNSNERPEIAFPHQVELADGTVIEVNSKEEVRAIRETCRPAPLSDCFTFVFPIEITNKDGEIVTLSSEEELKGSCERPNEGGKGFGRDRRERGRGHQIRKPALVFPVEIILTADSTQVGIASAEELKEVIAACLNN
jgi:hypothetical protein